MLCAEQMAEARGTYLCVLDAKRSKSAQSLIFKAEDHFRLL